MPVDYLISGACFQSTIPLLIVPLANNLLDESSRRLPFYLDRSG